jgi:hypothetical protein
VTPKLLLFLRLSLDATTLNIDVTIMEAFFFTLLEHLQEFAKSPWHPSIFGKTEKIVLQFGIQLGKF